MGRSTKQPQGSFDGSTPFTRKELFHQNLPLAFYFLGVMMTDGNVSGNRIKLDSKDKKWLEAICGAIFPNSRVADTGQRRWRIRTPEGYNVFELKDRDHVEAIQKSLFPGSQIEEVRAQLWTVTRRDEELVAWLERYGCIPRKSLILDFPRNIPTKMLRDFVRGLIDGDGSVWVHKHRQTKGQKVYAYQYASVGLVSGSRRFIAGLKAALETHVDPDAISVFVAERNSGGTTLVPKTGKTYVLRIHNWSAYKFLKWLYYEPDLLCLPRKRAIAEKLIGIYANRTNKDERVRLTKEAITLRRQKLSHGRIMQILNITRTQAKNYTRSEKGVKATDRRYARKTNPELVSEMRRLRREGWSPGLIANHLRVPKPTVEDNVRDITTSVTRTLRGDVQEQKRRADRILALLKEGRAISEVSAITGESLAKVKALKRKECPGLPVTSGKRRTVTPEKKEEMATLASQRLSNKRISEIVGLSMATVKKHLRGARSR